MVVPSNFSRENHTDQLKCELCPHEHLFYVSQKSLAEHAFKDHSRDRVTLVRKVPKTQPSCMHCGAPVTDKNLRRHGLGLCMTKASPPCHCALCPLWGTRVNDKAQMASHVHSEHPGEYAWRHARLVRRVNPREGASLDVKSARGLERIAAERERVKRAREEEDRAWEEEDRETLERLDGMRQQILMQELRVVPEAKRRARMDPRLLEDLVEASYTWGRMDQHLGLARMGLLGPARYDSPFTGV